MKKGWILLLMILMAALQAAAQTWPASLVGRWTFDNPSALLHATVGNDLVLTGTHTAAAGPSPGDGAVAIGVGSFYTCTHGIPANGGGIYVNEYSILFDVMVDSATDYHCFFQTNQSNSNDGDMFINPYSQIGITATGYTGFSVKAKNWYRVVITVDLGSSLRYYVDGKLVLNGVSQSVDGRYSLDPTVLFFADDDGEDNLIYVAQVAIFNAPLTAAQVSALGGFHSSNIDPYLQSPVAGTLHISWTSYDNTSTIVRYGTTTALGSSVSGSYEDIGTSPTINRWQTVKLTGLQADTRYYYRCISGTDTSAVFHFRTPPNPGTPGRHIRFLKTGDTQVNVPMISAIADTMKYVLRQLYGGEWTDSLSFIMHTGDIQNNGADLGRYRNEYFNPYSGLSAYVPMMVSIGNHEAENAYYYKFMKYQDLTGNNEKYYTFNLGDCQFIALNTTGTYNNSTQTTFLQTQMNASATDAGTDFVFVYNHQPGHSEIWPDGNVAYVEDNLYPVEAAYPKMVMTAHGHSHCYERGTFSSTHSSNWDFREVLSGGGGGSLDRWGMYPNQLDYPEIQKSFDHYTFVLVDVDMNAKTVHAVTYSLGTPDKPCNLEVVDRWHRKLNQEAPDKPIALSPDLSSTRTAVLTASPFSGLDSLMSSQFQLILASGSFGSPLINVMRDNTDVYGCTGVPNWTPIDLNNGIDLKTYTVGTGILTTGQSYLWRIRYRDQNVRWSNWSDPLQFCVTPDAPGVISGIDSMLPGTVVTYTIASVDGASSYTWTLPPGWTGSSSTTGITLMAGSTGGNVEVTADNACGHSPVSSLPVSIIPPELAVDPTVQNVSNEAGTTSFTISSNTGWSAVSDQSWCVPAPSGSGNGSLAVSYTSNTSIVQRTSNITITVTGLIPVEVTVIQAGVPGQPEPTNYPSGFSGCNIRLQWTDATGTVVPTSYLIRMSSIGFSSIVTPVDGTPIPDNQFDRNVPAGVQEEWFKNLFPNTTYYFKIFGFTGNGSAIDYKTDGDIPNVRETTNFCGN